MSQVTQITKHLNDGKSITPIEALNLYGCFRLAAVMHTVKKTMAIDTEIVSEKGKKFAKYSKRKDTAADYRKASGG